MNESFRLWPDALNRCIHISFVVNVYIFNSLSFLEGTDK